MGRRGVNYPAPRFEGFLPSSERASTSAKAIKRTEGRAEVALRKALWALGLRYRKNVKSLPGKPDIVLVRYRLVVFVDGDFWHGRDWEARLRKLQRGANAPYWVAKIAANMDRDARKMRELEEAGWRVLRVWETDVLRAPETLAETVRTLAVGFQTVHGRPPGSRASNSAPRRAASAKPSAGTEERSTVKRTSSTSGG